MNIGVWFFLTVVAAISNTAADNDICTKSLRIDVMRECSGNEDPEEEKRKHESDIDSCNEPVKNITVCQKTLNITFINLPPFSDLLIPYFFLLKVLPECCGKCAKWNAVNLFDSLRDYQHSTEQQLPDLNATNVLFPLLGGSSTNKQFEFFFLPIFEMSSLLLITRTREESDMAKSLLSGIFTIWPLLLVCLLMSCIAGFVAWVLETWNNDEEFRRPFIQGVFDGFWWGFVSMTTVGYGDKSPKSTSARIFSIVWILFGITICSMFTASLTNVITDAATPPTPAMISKKIGIPKERMFELSMVTSYGGHPVEGENVAELEEMLDDKKIYGILVDTLTYHFYITKGKYIETPMQPTVGSAYSYGIGFTVQEDYLFYSRILKDNKLMVETCLTMNSVTPPASESTNIFSPGSGMFYPFLGGAMVILSLILIFGIIYEIRRRSKNQKVKEGSEKKSNDGMTNDSFQGHYHIENGRRETALATNMAAS